MNDVEVIGWVADLKVPQRLEKIICHGQNGSKLEYRAIVPRSDVSSSTKRAGRFGFAIPTRLLADLGSPVSFTSEDGILLKSGLDVQLPAARIKRPEGERWFFLHIPKTAGTSVRIALAGEFPDSEQVYIYGDGHSGVDIGELEYLPLQQREQFRLMMGHCPLLTAAFFGDNLNHVVFLREPMSRMASNLFHNERSQSVYKLNGRDVPATKVAEAGLTEQFDNLFIRMIADLSVTEVPLGQIMQEHAEIALRRLQTFRFIGLSDSAVEHFEVLKKIMGIERGPRLATTNAGIYDTFKIPVEVRAQMEQRNQPDIHLYRRVVELGLAGRDLKVDAAGN